MSLGGLDLNLLVPLHALLELRNVTRAGERIHLSQPATSAALAKLRRHFGDELLVRDGREYQLTPLAQVLLPLVTEALIHADRALEVRPAFDAENSERKFTVAASDFAVTVLLEPLRNLLAIEAPNVWVEFSPIPVLLSEELLRRDLIVAPVGYGLGGPHDVLFRDRFVAVLDAHHPALAEGRAAMDLLRDLPHVIGRFGDNISTPADRLFDELGIQRKVASSVTGLLALPILVVGTDLVALVPMRLAERFAAQGRITIVEVPGAERMPLVEAVFWHPNRTADPALQWLRSIFLRASRALDPEAAHPAMGGGRDALV